MIVRSRPVVVVLGMMSKMPVAGVQWQTLQYLLGFQRLGCDVYYVEAHGITPTQFFVDHADTGWQRAAAFVGDVMGRFGLGDKWAYHLRFAGEACYGMSESRLNDLYRRADLIVNLHGGTQPLPEHTATDRLVYVETDPVQVQLELVHGVQETVDFLRQHCAYFTYGEAYGRQECLLPMSDEFTFVPTRQPVLLDMWSTGDALPTGPFTTIGNWQQWERQMDFEGEPYFWSKHLEFEKVLDLPARVVAEGVSFELALSRFDDAARDRLEAHGWGVRAALPWSLDLDRYRQYIGESSGEFTVAKDQNVRLRSGWFSDRSASYLAAGRPVVTQDTGFDCVLPTGEGLFAFGDVDGAAAAVEAVSADPQRHRAAAREIAREYFSSDVVLGAMLDALGISVRTRRSAPELGDAKAPLPPDLDLWSAARWPTELAQSTSDAAEALIPTEHGPVEDPDASIVIVTYGKWLFTKLCLASVLAESGGPSFEVIVVDNGSTDATVDGLRRWADADGRIQLVENLENTGFARANNQGMALARGSSVVLLNNDTIVPPGWLERLLGHLDDAAVGLVGPQTNRTCNEAETDVTYRTYGEFVAEAGQRATEHSYDRFDIPMLAMFCVAARRSTLEQVGTLDEGFGGGMFEDDDYALRVRAAGLRILCAEDVLVHHFGQATIGDLSIDGEYQATFERNRSRFERKWGIQWQPHRRRASKGYIGLRQRVRDAVVEAVPAGSVVLVVSKGDEELIALPGREGWHFPRSQSGAIADGYPADTADAIAQLDELAAIGAEYIAFPATAAWWLEHYRGLLAHLEQHGPAVVADDDLTLFRLVAANIAPPAAADLAPRLDELLMETRALRAETAELRDELRRHDASVEVVASLALERRDGEPDNRVWETISDLWQVLISALQDSAGQVPYAVLRARLRSIVVANTPTSSVISVISRGDDELLRLPGRTAWHFPRLADGKWAGFYPEDDATAVFHAEVARALGARFLVVPATAAWWLDHYAALRNDLARTGRLVVDEPGVGALWELGPLDRDPALSGLSLDEVLANAEGRGAVDPSVLDWTPAAAVADLRTDLAVFSPPLPSAATLPYLDDTIDLVFVSSAAPERLAEARRVATVGVVRPHAGQSDAGTRWTVEWKLPPAADQLTVSLVPVGGVDDGRSTEALGRSLPSGFRGDVILTSDHAVDPRFGRGDAKVDVRFVDATDTPAWAAATDAADGDVVAFVGPGVIPLAGWIDSMLSTLDRQPDAAIVSGRVVAIDASHLPAAENVVRRQAVASPDLFVVRRTALTRAGGLDPRAPSFAAAVAGLCHRAEASGTFVYSQPAAVAVRWPAGSGVIDR